MTDRPILFSAPMVRALLAGTKTQTRRVLKPQPYPLEGRPGYWNAGGVIGGRICINDRHLLDLHHKAEPGDRLWVRETVRAVEMEDGLDCVEYAADGDLRAIENTAEAAERWIDLAHYRGKRGASVNSIHMPRWASRLTLYVTGVRVERLQDISESDARAEGFEPDEGLREVGIVPSARGTFSRYWAKLHGISLPRKPSEWAANPWVAAYTFAVRLGNIDNLPATLEEVA